MQRGAVHTFDAHSPEQLVQHADTIESELEAGEEGRERIAGDLAPTLGQIHGRVAPRDDPVAGTEDRGRSCRGFRLVNVDPLGWGTYPPEGEGIGNGYIQRRPLGRHALIKAWCVHNFLRFSVGREMLSVQSLFSVFHSREGVI